MEQEKIALEGALNKYYLVHAAFCIGMAGSDGVIDDDEKEALTNTLSEEMSKEVAAEIDAMLLTPPSFEEALAITEKLDMTEDSEWLKIIHKALEGLEEASGFEANSMVFLEKFERCFGLG